jgi:hypothetical protein
MLLAVLAAVVALPAAAQSHPAPAGSSAVSVGFGVGVEPLSTQVTSATGATVSANPPVNLYVPVQITPQLRVEPSVGFWHLGANRNAPGTAVFSQSVWAVGLGGLYYFVPMQPAGIYAGARLGIAFRSQSDAVGNATRDVKATDFSIAPVLGGEYAFSQKFSVGAELQLPITWYGNASTTLNNVTNTPNDDRNGFATNGVVFLRYFFM